MKREFILAVHIIDFDTVLPAAPAEREKRSLFVFDPFRQDHQVDPAGKIPLPENRQTVPHLFRQRIHAHDAREVEFFPEAPEDRLRVVSGSVKQDTFIVHGGKTIVEVFQNVFDFRHIVLTPTARHADRSKRY